MIPLTTGQKWGQWLRDSAVRLQGKGFRTPSFKLTEANAKRHPDTRRNDKESGQSKAARSYAKRYS